MKSQEERLDYLIQYLLNEYEEKLDLPDSYKKKRSLLRKLVNIRPPKPISPDFLKSQDAFLQQEAIDKGIVTQTDIVERYGKIALWKGDITRLQIDAIVNAGNEKLLGCFVPGHHCIDNAIHTAAGVQLREECQQIMQGKSEPTGSARLTHGYNLPAQYVLHTVGPITKGRPTKRQEKQLADCYRSCLTLAENSNIRSIAFCCISTGLFGFPQQKAAEIAVKTVSDYLAANNTISIVIFNVFTEKDQYLYRERLKSSS